MSSMCRRAFLLGLAFVAAHEAAAEQPKVKVIAIESAMRAWQERYGTISRSTAYWQPRSDRTEPGNFPQDCFYGADLLDPQKAANLVNNLFDEMRYKVVGNFAKRESEALVENAYNIEWEGISLYGLPKATPENYVEVFTELVNVIRRCNIVLVGASSSSSPLTEVKRSDVSYDGWGTSGTLTCEEDKVLATQQLLANKLPISATDGLLGISATLVYNSYYHRYGAFITSWEGRYLYDLRRCTGTATLYVRDYSSPTAAQGYLGTSPATLLGYQTETAITGGVWKSKVYSFDEIPADIGCPDASVYSVKQSRFQRVRMAIRPAYQYHVEDTLVECEACTACVAGCLPGTVETSLGSLHARISLGGGPDGSAGALVLKSDLPATAWSTPAALKKQLQAGARALLDVNSLGPAGYPVLRQVATPQALIDIVALDSFAYELRYYTLANQGALDAQGFYTPLGPPFRVLKIENPDRSTTIFNRLRITPSGDGGGETSTFAYDDATRTWTLVKEKDGQSVTETRSSVVDAGTNRRTELHQIKDGTGRVVLDECNAYEVFPWNVSATALNSEELIESITDPSGAARKTSYTFYTDRATDGAAYGRLKYQIDPNGFWQKFDYDSAGNVQRVTTPFLNAALGAADNVRVKETFRSASIPHETNIEALVIGGTRTEVSRSYRNFNYNLITSIGCQTPGAAWDAADNLVTVTKHLKLADSGSRIASVVRPDGTGTFYAYQRNADGGLTTTVSTGGLNATRTGVIEGTRTDSTVGKTGELIEESGRDIASNLLTGYQIASVVDGFGRVTRREFLDGTFELKSYSCCGVDYTTSREGVRTDYTYDAFGRVETERTAGVTRKYTYDAAGRRLTTTRMGSDNSSILVESNVYDGAGRLGSATGAENRTTLFGETIDGAGRTVRTTTFPDGGTRVETIALDGSIISVGGTAVPPLAYDYGADAAGTFVKQIRVGSAGEQTEWIKTCSDFAGRPYKRVFPDGAAEQNYFNAVGQLVKRVDADGVTTLFGYNVRAEPEYVAVDMNRNGLIDFDGTDRIIRTQSEVVSARGTIVQRLTTTAWTTDNASSTEAVSVLETSVDGRNSWQTVHGLTTHVQTASDGTGGRSETIIAPDGTITTRQFQLGRTVSETVTHPAAGTLASTNLAYDPHGRVQSSADARNGATTLTYFDDDQVRTLTTPDPDPARSGPGYDPQVTRYAYDSAGRVNQITLPDGGVTTTTYYPTGQVRRTSGARTFPSEYAYDAQGRIKTLTTWQSYSTGAGKAVTTWNYDAQRGWLSSKLHADGKGPTYTYTAAGRLKTRAWARGVATTYTNDNAGEMASTTYSDGTPAIALAFDRLGRLATKTDGTGTCTYRYDGATSLVGAESHTAGLLAGIAVNRGFDGLRRVGTVSIVSGANILNQTTYGYDPASRMQAVAAGALAATYAYAPNSWLIQSVTLTANGSTRLTTTKSHDYLNRLQSISHLPSGSSPLSYAYEYNGANQRTQATREDGTAWRYGYDPLGQVTSAQRRLADATPMLGHDFGYAFDDIGNRRTATTNGRTATYTPNPLNQYAQRTVPGAIDVLGSAASTATVTANLLPTQRQGGLFYRELTVDNSTAPRNPAINIVGVQNNSGPNGEDAIATETRQAFLARTPEVFTHDADGNLTSDGRWTYTWDAENRLVAMETTPVVATGLPELKQRLEFTYDGHGRRLQKKVLNWTGSGYVAAKDVRFVYDEWNLRGELDGLNANVVARTHVWGLDLSGTEQGAGGVGGLLFTSSFGASYAVTYDGNGNVVGLIGMDDGAVAAVYDYGAFGEQLRTVGPAAMTNAFRFSTKYADNESGLCYFGFRYYQVGNGRWLSRDPIDEEGGANVYQFVANAPSSWCDPLGLALYAFDGTNNDGDRDRWDNTKAENGPTNVKILYDIYTGKNAFYAHGVGTRDGALNVFGLAGGLGGKSREGNALRSAEEFIKDGDTVADIIGFSRGAAQARDFANQLRQKYRCVTIRWIGIFDTVASFGLGGNGVDIGYDFGIPAGTGSVFHLTAGGERRHFFPLMSINDGPGQPNPNRNYTEISIPGAVHSDIGGGYRENRGLANFALVAMWRDGKRHDVPFGDIPSMYLNFAGSPHDSRWKNDKIAEVVIGGPRQRKIFYAP